MKLLLDKTDLEEINLVIDELEGLSKELDYKGETELSDFLYHLIDRLDKVFLENFIKIR